MLNPTVFKAHLGVYWRTQKILFLIFFTILIVNLGLQTFLITIISGSPQSFNISMLLPTLIGVLVGMLVAIPIIEVTSIPYLLTLGSRRKDILLTVTVNNGLYTTAITAILSILLGIYATTSNDLAAIYMGTFLTGWNSILPISVFNFLLFFMVTNIVFFIGATFQRWGLMWGMGSLLLILSFPVIFLKEFYHFYIWGGSYFFVHLIMILISVFFVTLSRLILSKIEVRSYRPRITFPSFIFFVGMLIILISSSYHGVDRLSSDTSTININGRFASYDQGVSGESFYSTGNQKLHLSWRSHLKEGDLVFTLKSPSQEIVYTASGSTNELVTIPLTEGEWNFAVTVRNAFDGNYSLRGLVKK